MNADAVIGRAARLLLQWRRLFWFLGLLGVLSSLVNALVWRIIGLPQLSPSVTDVSTLMTEVVEGWLLKPVGPILGVVVLFLGGLVFWFIAATAEGGIIRATERIEDGEQPTFRQAWSDGRQLLVKFIAIDTLLFLPLFLLLLAIMLVGSTGLIGTVVVNLQRSAALRGILQGLGLTAAVSAPLLCLLLPVGLATYFLRLAAFREAALNNAGTRQSIRAGYRTLRANLGAAAGVGILLYAVSYLGGMLLSIVTIPLSLPGLLLLAWPWLGGGQEVGSGFVMLATAAGLLGTFVSAAGNAFLRSYGAIGWTLAYRSWLGQGAPREAGPGGPMAS